MTAASEKAKSTIVVKRIKKGGHAAHGAAWKIAYADFVTAMMAFFLLMWLLGSTTKGDLKGISEYFQSPLQVSLSGGTGSGDATSVVTGGGEDLSRTAGQVKRGEVEARLRRRNEVARIERVRMQAVKLQLDKAVQGNEKLAQYKDQVRVDLVPDGLRIQIVDDFKRPMFDIGSAHVKEYMREILREIGRVLNEVDSRILLMGHTDAAQYAAGDHAYSNWELSADRANASRRELVAGGMQSGKVVRVAGLADSAPLDRENPANPLNRRISIIVLNKLAEERLSAANGEVEAGNAGGVEQSILGTMLGGGAGTADPGQPVIGPPQIVH